MISVFTLMNLIMATTTTGASLYMMKKGVDVMINKPLPITTLTLKEFNTR